MPCLTCFNFFWQYSFKKKHKYGTETVVEVSSEQCVAMKVLKRIIKSYTLL